MNSYDSVQSASHILVLLQLPDEEDIHLLHPHPLQHNFILQSKSVKLKLSPSKDDISP